MIRECLKDCQIPNQNSFALGAASNLSAVFWQVAFQKLTNAECCEKLGGEGTPFLSKESGITNAIALASFEQAFSTRRLETKLLKIRKDILATTA